MGATYDACIIGGGVIGCTIAYFLAKKGIRAVVIEKNTLGSLATHAGAGMLGAQVEMEQPDPLFDLGIKSRSLFKGLQEELKEISGRDIELQTSGIFRLAVSEEDRKGLLSRQKWQLSAGQKAEWLEDGDLRKEIGDIVGPTFGALYLPDDHQVRNMALLRALVCATTKLGAVFLERTELIDFIQKGDRVVGVKTSNGQIYADHFVLAAGAWSGLLGKRIGIDLPVFPVKGQSLLARIVAPITPYTIFTHGTYMLPKLSGQLYIGATMENAGFDTTPSLQAISQLLANSIRIMPSIKSLGFDQNLVGLRPGSADGFPFLGKTPGIDGLFTATGHYRNGVLLSPITGLVISELIANETPSIDLTPFQLQRFLH